MINFEINDISRGSSEQVSIKGDDYCLSNSIEGYYFKDNFPDLDKLEEIIQKIISGERIRIENNSRNADTEEIVFPVDLGLRIDLIYSKEENDLWFLIIEFNGERVLELSYSPKIFSNQLKYKDMEEIVVLPSILLRIQEAIDDGESVSVYSGKESIDYFYGNPSLDGDIKNESRDVKLFVPVYPPETDLDKIMYSVVLPAYEGPYNANDIKELGIIDSAYALFPLYKKSRHKDSFMFSVWDRLGRYTGNYDENDFCSLLLEAFDLIETEDPKLNNEIDCIRYIKDKVQEHIFSNYIDFLYTVRQPFYGVACMRAAYALEPCVRDNLLNLEEALHLLNFNLSRSEDFFRENFSELLLLTKKRSCKNARDVTKYRNTEDALIQEQIEDQVVIFKERIESFLNTLSAFIKTIQNNKAQ